MQRFVTAYSGDEPPPWDIGRPQRHLLAAFDELAPAGAALDLGCGTGEHVLELARRGLEAWGVDVIEAAIVKARAKAQAQGLDAHFVHGDATQLGGLGRSFDLVVDCGFFHMLADVGRERCVEQVRAVLRPGGHHVMLGFSTNPSEHGPRGYSRAELEASFAQGFTLVSVREAVFDVIERERPAMLSIFQRTG